MKNGFFQSINLFLRETKELTRFLNAGGEPFSKLVFYSEHAAYAKFFSPVLDELTDIPQAYLTSDEHDPLLASPRKAMEVFYIKNLLGGAFQQMKARTFVMTMPDLGQYHLKRAPGVGEHVYLFHALVSTHMIYRKGAFDHYDTLLCAGPHHVEEVRRTENLYGLKPKNLVEAGYPLLDRIYADYQLYAAKRKTSRRDPVVLIAPSWAPGNILLTCLEPLVASLRQSGFRVIVRPHPEFIKRCSKQLAAYQKNSIFEGVEFEIHPRQENSLFEADVLITDWSGISLEYAFGTERPVLFIDTPRKVLNPEYEKLGIEPIEVELRSKIGQQISISQARLAGAQALKLLKAQSLYREGILKVREKTVFNFGCSAQVVAEMLQKTLAL